MTSRRWTSLAGRAGTKKSDLAVLGEYGAADNRMLPTTTA